MSDKVQVVYQLMLTSNVYGFDPASSTMAVDGGYIPPVGKQVKLPNQHPMAEAIVQEVTYTVGEDGQAHAVVHLSQSAENENKVRMFTLLSEMRLAYANEKLTEAVRTSIGALLDKSGLSSRAGVAIVFRDFKWVKYSVSETGVASFGPYPLLPGFEE